jgi:NTE family protein
MSALLPPGRISTSMITGGIEPLFGRTWPTEPLWVCAVRLDRGQRVVFGRDGAPKVSVGEAVAASCAIPSFFEPVEIDGVRHVDGGVHSPTNLDLLGGLGLDLIVVSSPMSMAGRSLPRPSADWAVRRFCRAQLDSEAVGVRRRGTPVLAFQPTADDAAVMGLNAMDPSRRAAVAERAFASAKHRISLKDVQERVTLLR